MRTSKTSWKEILEETTSRSLRSAKKIPTDLTATTTTTSVAQRRLKQWKSKTATNSTEIIVNRIRMQQAHSTTKSHRPRIATTTTRWSWAKTNRIMWASTAIKPTWAKTLMRRIPIFSRSSTLDSPLPFSPLQLPQQPTRTTMKENRARPTFLPMQRQQLMHPRVSPTILMIIAMIMRELSR